MADKIRMDSHKLIYHPERVAAWKRGENIYPIELEIGLTNACNHRCIFLRSGLYRLQTDNA